jgi:hypothetical protein
MAFVGRRALRVPVPQLLFGAHAGVTHRALLLQTLRSYASALTDGTKHTYEVLPRLLTLWLDLGERVAAAYVPFQPTHPDARSSNPMPMVLMWVCACVYVCVCVCWEGMSSAGSGRASTGEDAASWQDIQNTVIRPLVQSLPTPQAWGAYAREDKRGEYWLTAAWCYAQWYTALSQLTSRLTHGHVATAEAVVGVLVRVLCAHPHQTMWHLLPHGALDPPQGAASAAASDGVSHLRRSRCRAILETAIVRVCGWGPVASSLSHWWADLTRPRHSDPNGCEDGPQRPGPSGRKRLPKADRGMGQRRSPGACVRLTVGRGGGRRRPRGWRSCSSLWRRRKSCNSTAR